MKIEYIRSSRSKSLRITIGNNGIVRVTRPFWCSQKKAERFVEEKKEWILSQVERISTKITSEALTQTNSYISLDTNNEADIQLPSHSQKLEKEEILDIRKKLQMHAKKILPHRLKELSIQSGLPYNKVTVRHQSTRWGSCSTKNNINLNIELLRLPDELRDYVILHELAHTIHKDHSKRFWDFLEEICPGSKKLDKKLKNESILLIQTG